MATTDSDDESQRGHHSRRRQDSPTSDTQESHREYSSTTQKSNNSHLPPQPSKVLHVANLPRNCLKFQYEDMLGEIGAVEVSVQIKNKNSALVQMSTIQDAQNVMATIQDRGPLVLDGFKLRVEYSLSESLKLSHRPPDAPAVSKPSVFRPQMIERQQQVNYAGSGSGGGGYGSSSHSTFGRSHHPTRERGGGRMNDEELMDHVGRTSILDPHQVALFRSRAEYLAMVGLDIFDDHRTPLLNINDREEFEYQESLAMNEERGGRSTYDHSSSSSRSSQYPFPQTETHRRSSHDSYDRRRGGGKYEDEYGGGSGSFQQAQYKSDVIDGYPNTSRYENGSSRGRGGQQDGGAPRYRPRSTERNQVHIFPSNSSSDNASTTFQNGEVSQGVGLKSPTWRNIDQDNRSSSFTAETEVNGGRSRSRSPSYGHRRNRRRSRSTSTDR